MQIVGKQTKFQSMNKFWNVLLLLNSENGQHWLGDNFTASQDFESLGKKKMFVTKFQT